MVGRLLRLVKPELAVPFAGPMCFLDPELRQHNRWLKPPGLFPDQKQAAEFLSARLQGMQQARTALEALYQALSPEQKATIDHPFRR